MPATFLLVLLIVALALAAVPLALIGIIFACTRKFRRPGTLSFATGAVVGGIALGCWLLLSYLFPAPVYSQWQSIAIIFCAGFTIGFGLAFAWQFFTRTRPNNSFKPSPLRGLGPTGTASGGPA